MTMTDPTDHPDAWGDVVAAAARAGVVMRDLGELDEIHQASRLFDTVWPDPTQTIMPVNLVRAVSSAGSYVAGAYAGGQMVGAIVGFIGFHGDVLMLHSHILGVLPDVRGRSVGYALKLHQRAWCLERGIDTVMWTFDPLVRRNAYFNLMKLGAVGARYETNFYGEMTDGINAGDETDRLVVVWQLRSPRAIQAASGRAVPAPPSQGPALLDIDDDGGPRTAEASGDTMRCRIPADILAVRAGDRDLALRWRRALRDTLGSAVNGGFDATAMDREGWYTLTRSQDVRASP